ncbi:methyltransferase [Streptomyces sp. JNUCC 64]
MGDRSGWAAELDPVDLGAVDEALDFVRRTAPPDALRALLGSLGALDPLDGARLAAVAAHCVPAHVAELVFPRSLDRFVAALRASGLRVTDPVPSVVVRDRLAHRHRVPAGRLDVSIVHLALPGDVPGRMGVELFVLPVPPGSPLTPIAARERAEPAERHAALGVLGRDEVVLAGLRALLTDRTGLLPDGGGYNPGEDCTVLYYRRSGGPRSGPPAHDRLELRAPGARPAALAVHLADGPDDEYTHERALLTLLTGAWTTRALAVAAELGIPDRLPATAAELADRLAADPDAVARLLRYLESVGVVARHGDRYALTPLGGPLRRTAEHSLRPVALLYGGLFYRSYGALAHAVRTGEDGFTAWYGRGLFDHLAEHPDQAALFDAAMAANAPMFLPVPDLVDLSDVQVVVDVAGGEGELLGRFLRHAPQLTGVLLEQAPVLDRARARLAASGHADRCAFVAGDFTRDVPTGGDLYVLSRILHDWDDERCLAILRHCADRMAPGRALLLIERLLPTDGRPSLAVPWDLHMLCNTGGRERTGDHYARLLDTAGFDLVSVDRLPLDGGLLRAVRRPDRTPTGSRTTTGG